MRSLPIITIYFWSRPFYTESPTPTHCPRPPRAEWGGAGLGGSVVRVIITKFSIPQFVGPPTQRRRTRWSLSDRSNTQRRRCRRCNLYCSRSGVRACSCWLTEVPQFGSLTAESGAEPQRVAAVHCHLAVVRPCGRLRCAERHIAMGRDCAARSRRCALARAPTHRTTVVRVHFYFFSENLLFVRGGEGGRDEEGKGGRDD